MFNLILRDFLELELVLDLAYWRLSVISCRSAECPQSSCNITYTMYQHGFFSYSVRWDTLCYMQFYSFNAHGRSLSRQRHKLIVFRKWFYLSKWLNIINTLLGCKVLSEKFAICSEGGISASGRRSLNPKGSAELALKND